jgi:hypothetical protein
LKRFFAALNVQGWVGLAVAALLAVLLVHSHGETRHWSKQSAQFEKLYRGEVAKQQRIAKQALELKAKIDALTAKIAAEERTKNDVEDRRIAAAADALRVRGPGKAVCIASIPAAAGGHVEAGGPGDASVHGVPDPQRVALIGLPVSSAVGFAEQHDVFRAEVIAWRTWYKRVHEAWPKL